MLFRDLDVVEPWTQDAREGRFEVLAQSGHVAGAPTYLPMGELAPSRCWRPGVTTLRAVQDVSALLWIQPLAIR